MKKAILLIMIMLFTANVTYADNLQLQELEQTQQVGFENITIQSLTEQLMSGEFKWDIQYILGRIFSLFSSEVYASLKIMLIIIALSIISGMLTNMQSSFGQAGTAEVAHIACFLIIIGVAVRGLSFTVNIGIGLINDLSFYINLLVPIVMSITVAGGSLSGALVFEPLLIGSTQISGVIIKDFLIPLAMTSLLISVANNISGKLDISKLSELIRKVVKWILGILLTLCAGIMTVQGLVTPIIDGAASKTAKFAIGNFIPVVGGILSDSINVVMGYSMAVKNAVGAAGLIFIVIVGFVPLMKMIASIAIFHITAAIIQPISDKRITNTISDIGSTLTLIFIMTLSMEFLFLINLTISLMATNTGSVLGR